MNWGMRKTGVTNFFNYSPYNVPNGNTESYFSLMCETTYSLHKPVDKDRIIEETIQGLINSGMITEEECGRIVSRYLIDIPSRRSNGTGRLE